MYICAKTNMPTELPTAVIRAYLGKYPSDLGQEREDKDVDVNDLLEVVLKLENLKKRFDEMQRNALALSNYYTSVNDTENADRFTKVADMFGRLEEKVDAIKERIRSNLNNPGFSIEEIKEEIKQLKAMLRSILFVILGVDETQPAETSALAVLGG